jgi:DNA-directed RNA polymerase subunit RPC12/RpoP
MGLFGAHDGYGRGDREGDLRVEGPGRLPKVTESSKERESAEEEGKKAAFLRAFQESNSVTSAAALAVDLLFPNFKCLRCGNEQFSVSSLSHGHAPPSKIDIVCSYCGMIESHLPTSLIDAALKLSHESKNEQ